MIKALSSYSVALLALNACAARDSADTADRSGLKVTSDAGDGSAVSSARAPEAGTPGAPSSSVTESAVGDLPTLDVTVLLEQWHQLAVDPAGGVVVVKPHSEQIADPEDLLVPDAPPNGYYSVRHINSDGQETWVTQLPGLQVGGVLAPDPETAVLFGGFQGSLTIGDTTLQSTTNPSQLYGSAAPFQDDDFARGYPSLDGFVLRLEGEALSWIQPFAGYGSQMVHAGAVLANGDVLLAGSFVADIIAGPLTVRNPLGATPESSFLARVDAEGTVLTMTAFAGGQPLLMAVNANDAAVVVTRTERKDGGSERALTRFDATGQEQPSRLSWDWRAAEVGGVALDDNGNVYLSVQSGDLHDQTFLGEQLSSEYALVKLTQEGEVLWLRRFPGGSIAPVLGLQQDNLAVAGYLSATTDLGGGPLAVSSDQGSLFFAEFELAGTHRYSVSFGEQGVISGVYGSPQGWVFPLSISAPFDLGPTATQLPAGEHIMLLNKGAR